MTYLIKSQKGKKPGAKPARRCAKSPNRVPEGHENVHKRIITEYGVPAMIYGSQSMMNKKRQRSKSSNSKPVEGMNVSPCVMVDSEEPRAEVVPVKKGSMCSILEGRSQRDVQYQLPTSTFFNSRGRRYKENDFKERNKQVNAQKDGNKLDDDKTYETNPTCVLRKEIHDWKVHQALNTRVENLLDGIELTKNNERCKITIKCLVIISLSI